ncbi:unnamed protein product [Larinioides sclopetarius]|uniref:Uncharacterized protein n=1 Tax=Larinioides sclopetarius TaxID=280406 RepID=A0AAV2A3I0_9ARAC
MITISFITFHKRPLSKQSLEDEVRVISHLDLHFFQRDFFFGAMAGAFLAESTGEDFKPLWDVITEMPVDAKQRLLDKIKEILQRLDLTDSTTLAAMAAGVAANLRSQISAAVIAFFQTEMSFQAAGR